MNAEPFIHPALAIAARIGTGAATINEYQGEVTRWEIHGRCPHCFRNWRFDVLSMKRPDAMDPQKIGSGLICGVCQAIKTRLMVIRERTGPWSAWTEAMENLTYSRIWGAAHAGDPTYWPRIIASQDPVDGELIDTIGFEMDRLCPKGQLKIISQNEVDDLIARRKIIPPARPMQ